MKIGKREANIPVPEIVAGRKSKYPWNGMKVGDSFLAAVDDNEKDIRILQKRLRSSASQRKIRNRDEEYTVRTVVDGIRVWRIK